MSKKTKKDCDINKLEFDTPKAGEHIIAGIAGVLICAIIGLFVLYYFPLFVTDSLAIINGIPFNHSEMEVYECTSIREMSSVEILEDYTIFKGLYGDRLIKNDKYYFDHCKQIIKSDYSGTISENWCCFHMEGD